MIFKVAMEIYIEALDEKMARGVAELSSYSATHLLRKRNSSWVEDKITTFKVVGEPVNYSGRLPESYRKEPMIASFGEEKSIRFMNSVDLIY